MVFYVTVVAFLNDTYHKLDYKCHHPKLLSLDPFWVYFASQQICNEIMSWIYWNLDEKLLSKW